MKFPSTPHLVDHDGISIRDDKVLGQDERSCFLDNEVIVEEKIDGSNLGVSFDQEGVIQLQNRGTLLQEPMTGQWKTLPEWVALRCDCLFEVLTDQYLLFGEWCYAKHSVFYDQLPDWFIGFDIFDLQTKRFVCKETRDDLLTNLGVSAAPWLATGRLSLDEIVGFIGESRFGKMTAEGVYLRLDDGKWLSQRAKLVRPDFIQSIDQHWTRSPLEVNQLAAQNTHYLR